MQNGWVKIHRKIMSHWIWSNDSYYKWWSYMLFRANHEETKILIGSSIEICREGEFITSINHLCRDLKTTPAKIRTFISLLENDSMIVKNSTSIMTKITICNYESYQSGQQTNRKPIANQSQTDNKPITTDKNLKNLKNLKNNISFDIFWDLYGKKIGKAKAEMKWNKLSNEIQQQIIDYIPKYKKFQPDPKYRKNPDTFLNNRSWEDELFDTTSNQVKNETKVYR